MAVALLLLSMIDGGWAFGQPPSGGWVREIRAGVAAHDVDGLWSGESKEKGPDICAEVVFKRPLFRLFKVDAHPNLGVSLNTRGDTSKVYGGFLLTWNPAAAVTFSTGLGLALHDGERDTPSDDRKSLGSPVLFRIPIEIGVLLNRHYRILLAFDHMSNAYLASPNEGMDTIGIMVGYRF